MLDKLKELLNYFGEYVQKLEDLLPPGTKLRHWLELIAPFLLILAIVLLCCPMCCCGSRRKGKMMKAPGRDNRISRNAFQSNTRSYFRDLRQRRD